MLFLDSLSLRDVVTEHLLRATADEVRRGCEWYTKAHEFALDLAAAYEMSLNQVAAVIAALSPGCRWAMNKRDAEAYCYAAYYGKPQPRATTYKLQAAKAWMIANTPGLDGAGYAGLLSKEKAIKCRAFYWNIVSPECVGDITCDRHVFRVFGLPDALSHNQYLMVADAIRDVAEVFGYLPQDAQAILWVRVRGRDI